ncbi:uncharacterized protein LOC141854153 isoform X2 [Brevipalpus obovatus]|uniref:uncharacterized protein LOC141854153 isoform X2 n=1 Tax=Brevipalpus obovatus TaxID=246614 RepID=UPI003D9EC93C
MSDHCSVWLQNFPSDEPSKNRSRRKQAQPRFRKNTSEMARSSSSGSSSPVSTEFNENDKCFQEAISLTTTDNQIKMSEINPESSHETPSPPESDLGAEMDTEDCVDQLHPPPSPPPVSTTYPGPKSIGFVTDEEEEDGDQSGTDSSGLSEETIEGEEEEEEDEFGALLESIGDKDINSTGIAYTCQFCDVSLSKISIHRKHEQTSFQCDHCKRFFKHKRSRDRHVKIHTGDKRYKCTNCAMAFSRSDHLRIHMKTHDHAKPHQCETCNRGYASVAALTSHRQSHKKDGLTMVNGVSKIKPLQPGTTDLSLSSSINRSGGGGGHNNNNNNHHHNIVTPKTLDHHHPSDSVNIVRDIGSAGDQHMGKISREKHHDITSSSVGTNFPPSTRDKISVDMSKQQAHDNIRSIMNSISNKNKSGPNNTDISRHRDGNNKMNNNNNNNNNDNGNKNVRPSSPDQLITCTICGEKCASLDTHIRDAHLHHFFVAQLIQNSIYGANFANWPGLMPPPPTLAGLAGANGTVNDLSSSAHFAAAVAASLGRSAPSSSNTLSPKSSGGKLLSPLMGRVIGGSGNSVGGHHNSASSSPTGSNNNINSLSSSTGLPFMCNQCSPSPSFPDLESFRIHQSYHLQSQIFSASNPHLLGRLSNGSSLIGSSTSPSNSFTDRHCIYCDTPVASGSDMESHLINCHLASVSNQYGCEMCQKVFHKPDELARHQMDLHSKQIFQCMVCSSMLDSATSLQAHFNSKHSPSCKIYKCTLCGQSSTNEQDFKTHLRLMHYSGTAFPSNLPYHHLHPSLSLSSAVALASVSSPITAATAAVSGGGHHHHHHHHHHPSSTTSSSTSPNIFFPTTKPYFKCHYCGEDFHVEYQLEKHMESVHPSSSRRSPHSPSQSPPPSHSRSPPQSQPQSLTSRDVIVSNSGDSRRERNDSGHHQRDGQHSEFTRKRKCIDHDDDSRRDSDDHSRHSSPSSSPNPRSSPLGPSNAAMAAAAAAVVSSMASSRLDSDSSSPLRPEKRVATSARSSPPLLGSKAPSKTTTATSSMIPTKCNICDETCISATDLAQHKLNRHCMFARGASDCVHCRSSVSTEADFIAHMIKHHTSPSNCPPSSNKSPSVTSKQQQQQKQSALIVEHNSLVSSSTATMVDPSSSPVVDMEKRSTSIYDPIGELIRWPVTCVVCKLSLNSLDDVIIHGQFHCNGDDGEKLQRQSIDPPEKLPSSQGCAGSKSLPNEPQKDQYMCALCQSDHKNLVQLMYHLIDVHEFWSENRTKKIKCPVCVEKYSDTSKFLAHWKHLHLIDYSTLGQRPVNIGHDEQPIHRCSRCDMRFWFQSERYNHELREHEISPSSSCLIPDEIFSGDHRESASKMDSDDRWASHMDHVESDKEDVSAEDGEAAAASASEEEEEEEVMEEDERPIDDEDVTCVNVNQGDEGKEEGSQKKERSSRLAAVNGDEDGP